MGSNFNPPTPCGVGRLCGLWGRGQNQDFNPPTPCGVGPTITSDGIHAVIFQSTHPVWGGTWDYLQSHYNALDFNPPTPCGVGPELNGATWGYFGISIHPPRVGWDQLICTPGPLPNRISIHPPRVGWDLCGSGAAATKWYFNPPTPCGVGRWKLQSRTRKPEFQSTHPVWGGTLEITIKDTETGISIHPPRVGWDHNGRKILANADISIHPPRVGWD